MLHVDISGYSQPMCKTESPMGFFPEMYEIFLHVDCECMCDSNPVGLVCDSLFMFSHARS